MEKSILITKADNARRLDSFLTDNLVSLSRSKVQKFIKSGEVRVKGKLKRCNYRLRENDNIKIIIVDQPDTTLKPYCLEVDIIYEDKDIIIVNKPFGLVVHPPTANYYHTLVNALIYMGKELSDLNNLRRGIVHRLDKETTGVMVIAKNNFSHLNLIEQFKLRKVKKEYRAIVWGVIKQDSLQVDLPLKRDNRHRLRMKVNILGVKNAATDIGIIKRFSQVSYLKLKPSTGRMHQLRVHLSFLGYPILGDKKYGRKDNFSNLFLHAYRLHFYHPRTNELLKFQAPLPQWFSRFIKSKDNV